ncbi:MAG: hypothetical protein F6J90_11340 [Moorea sp. SIOASIH]|uniref:hypothetical protein n=1 Tax=Moorena sp. SIOASIH TaxID=2607817 RepID=UPI0013B6A081|nr:hypothetical protein [Moorena sp. SIOASIH]NEO36870.1 hypothetical protein [Moorena sp. SIOASIH]
MIILDPKFPTPYSLLPTPCSLFPVPCSLCYPNYQIYHNSKKGVHHFHHILTLAAYSESL